MKKYIFCILLIISICFQSFAQNIVTLEQCHEWSEVNAPNFAQISKYEELSVIKQKDAIWSYLPKFDINGQATYQNPVLKIESADYPMLEEFFPVFPHDYYKFTFDLNMPVYDGGTTNYLKKYNRISSEIDILNSEIALYNIKERVNGIYLNIFFTEGSLNILNLHLENLDRDISKMRTLAENGTVLKSNVDILEAEKLKIEQQKIEMEFSRSYLIRILGEYTNKDLSQATFVLPKVEINDFGLTSNRLEMEAFTLQKTGLDYQKKLLTAESQPKLNIFASGGYARSTYNFFDTDFGWQYMVGASFKIPLINWFKTKVGQDYLTIQQDVIDLQLSDYERNVRIQMMQKLTDIEKYSKMIIQDDAIVEKNESMIASAQMQLEEGIITANDYLKELTNQSEALLNQQLHKLQLLQAKIEFNALKGDLEFGKLTNE
ncbi:MAG: TolC family protein [Bacteroidales bacterium]|jgi:outer membrane protein TolC|nr:TolC family protein [Bacteroidales bacterium]